MFDIITVVFSPELDSLRLQARSIDLYVENVDSILVIVNDDAGLGQNIDPAWWGRYQQHVKLINRNSFGNQWSSNGWVNQQALKLLTSAQSPDWAIILDAKTVFVQPLEDLSTRPSVGQLDVYPVFEPSRRIANSLFGIDLNKQLGPGGVPFVINGPLTQQMIQWIESHTRQSFATWFQDQGRLTEFILYSAWVVFRTGSLDSIYEVSITNIKPVNVCHSEVARFEHKLQEMSSASTVSIHRNAWSQLTDNQQQRYLEFLRNRGIQ